ncbi:MAG: toxin-activating lysine-acyltransferase [Phycisphaerales bacterium]|nr:toxin-activating lysine-acyltransferase [Hyphomonadaceae bacterium]
MSGEPKRSSPTVSHMLGEVVWVLSQSSLHKHFAIGDLQWMVMPPILANQFRVFHAGQTPVGVALWALLSEDAEARLCAAVESGAGARLRPDDWKSGDRLWLVELVGIDNPDRDKMSSVMLDDVTKSVFAGKRFKFHAADPVTGKRAVREMTA